MKAFVALFAVLAVAMVSADPDKYEMMLKKWGKMKAAEGCFGSENMKDWMLMMKKAKAKCSNKPAPELKLAMFANKVASANAFVHAGKTEQREKFINELMRKEFVEKLMKREMFKKLMGDDDDFPFISKFKNRFTRETDEEAGEAEAEGEGDHKEGDLAAAMVKKIEMMEMKMMSEIGNMTCILETMGVINEDMEIDVDAMDKMVDAGKWSAEESSDGVDRTWLASELKHIHHMCKDLSDAVPESILNNCDMPHYITKLIYFKKCKKFHKKEACMFSDVRNKLAGHDIDVEELAEEAGKDVETTVALSAFVIADSIF